MQGALRATLQAMQRWSIAVGCFEINTRVKLAFESLFIRRRPTTGGCAAVGTPGSFHVNHLVLAQIV